MIPIGVIVVSGSTASAQNAPWLAPRSAEFDSIVRPIDESSANSDYQDVRQAYLALVERLMAGDPGGSTPVGEGLFVGAGPYLRASLQRLSPVYREKIVQELRLFARSRFSAEQSIGIDPQLDHQRARLLIDLTPDILGTEWLQPLIAAAYERGDFSQWHQLQRITSGWVTEGQSIEFSESRQRYGSGITSPPPSNLEYLESQPIDLESLELPTDGTIWKRGMNPIGVASTATMIWYQDQNQIRAFHRASGNLIWEKNLKPSLTRQRSPQLPRQRLNPLVHGDFLFFSFNSEISCLNSITGELVWTLPPEKLFGEPRIDDRWQQLSSPIALPGGIGLVGLRYEGTRVESYGMKIQRNGTVLWIRSLGESTGATWLALQGDPAPPIYLNGLFHWASGRGHVLALREQDGAVVWTREFHPRGPVGLLDHLRFGSFQRQSLILRNDALFHYSPGTGSFFQIEAQSGRLLSTLPLSQEVIWNVSKDGDRCLFTDSQGRTTSWSGFQNSNPVFEWQREIPSRIKSAPLSLGLSPAGDLWAIHEDSISIADPDGNWLFHQATSNDYNDAVLLENGIAAFSESGSSWISTKSVENVDTDTPTKALLSLIHQPSNFPMKTLDALRDLSGYENRERSLRRQVRLTLDRNDLDIPQKLRTPLEVALISAELNSENRLRVAWQRALNARDIGAYATSSSICQLILSETVLSLERNVLALTDGRKSSSIIGFTALLLELDKKPGGTERVQKREERAQRELSQIDIQDPRLWKSLAARRPGCPTGRGARLQAAESYYRSGDLESCIQQLNFLVTAEPTSEESIVARLRKIEVLREQGQKRKAIAELNDLKDSHGSLGITRTIDGTVTNTTLGERLDQISSEMGNPVPKTPSVPGFPLQLAWSGRFELEHLRSTSVHPLTENESLVGDPRMLLLTLSGARMIDTKNGKSHWNSDLSKTLPRSRGGIILDRSARAPDLLHIDAEKIVLRKNHSILCLETTTGNILWFWDLPQGDNDRLEKCISDSETVLITTSIEEILSLSVSTGELLWKKKLNGILASAPVLEDEFLILGYAIPDKVEIRNVSDGEVAESWELEGEVSGLACSPLVSEWGPLVGTQGGLIEQRDWQGNLLWDLQLPHAISNLHILADKKQLVSEMFWSEAHPTLFGIEISTGSICWKKSLPQEKRRISAIHSMDTELIIVCGDFLQRNLQCIDARLVKDLSSIPEAELMWNRDLAQAYDTVELSEHGDWLLVVDKLRGDLTILDRHTGTPLRQRNGLSEMTRFTRPLGRLHHASIIHDQLITVSARGTAAFSSLNRETAYQQEWERVEKFLNDDSLSTPRSDSKTLNSLDIEIAELENILQDTLSIIPDRLDASWRLESAERLRAKRALEVVDVPFMPVPPLIDGSLAEPWGIMAGIPIEKPRHVRALQGIGEIRIPYRDRADLSGRVFLGWSAAGLHLAIEVDDDLVTSHDRDAKRWVGDCLLLVLDTLGDGGQRPRSDDQVLTLAFVPPQKQPDPEKDENGENSEDSPDAPFPEEDEEEELEGEHVVMRRANSMGVTYEMTIPWTTILASRENASEKPWPGLQMGLGIAVIDDDTGTGATKYLGLTPGIVLHKEMDRLWEGCCPDLLLPIRLVE